VERPADYGLIEWFDMSGMRPDEYLRQDAAFYTEIVACRNAIYEGEQAALDEQKAEQKIIQMMNRGVGS
jgi:hypothetical protein